MQNLSLTWGGNFKTITDQGILEGSGIVFGSEEQPDISVFKDFFTKDTYVNPEDSFTTTLFMEHCFSYDKPIGKAHMYKTDKGWEVTAELNMEDPVVKARFPEIKSGNWGFSTGAVGHAVVREKKNNGTHHIKQWAVGEISITKTPAEPKALIHSVKSLDEYYTPNMEDMDMEEDQMENQMPTYLMEIIRALLDTITKKEIETLKSNVSDELKLVKDEILELKATCKPCQAMENDPIEDDEDKACGKKPKRSKKESEQNNELEEELTVLKSVHEELINSHEELQSSFIEKEALLSEKMALLSELQELVNQKEELTKTLEKTLDDNKIEIENLNKRIDIFRKANEVLSK